MPAQGRSINLLPVADFDVSFWGKFLKWAVTAGRYIIIVTEMVVILAFLSRFSLDSQISKITTGIDGKKNILEAQQQSLQEFLAVQAKLDAADRIIASSTSLGSDIGYITQRIPSSNVRLNRLQILIDEINIFASTNSENGIGQTVAALSREGRWKTIELVNVDSDPLKGINFTLKIKK